MIESTVNGDGTLVVIMDEILVHPLQRQASMSGPSIAALPVEAMAVTICGKVNFPLKPGCFGVDAQRES